VTTQSQPLSDPWSRLSAYVAATLGLNFPRRRQEDLQRSFQQAARELGYESPVACIEWLLSQPPAAKLVQVLASHLTVGETYFYRERPALDALATDVLPALIRMRRASGRHYLRLWCAGCCTGEEAYTLAILLHRLLPDLTKWDIAIQATDVNERFLAKAERGCYGAWSFRNAPEWLRHRYFSRDAIGAYSVIPEIRRLVRFGTLNLIDGDDGFSRANVRETDVVLCRNVLMYFTPPHIRSVVNRLWECLNADGWLVVAAGESAAPPQMASFRAASYPGAILFQKTEKRQGTWATPAALEPTSAKIAAVQHAATVAPPDVRLTTELLARRARDCANEGRLGEALTWCNQWLKADRLDAIGHYLHAVILLEQGDIVWADAALQRATFLNGNFIMAHVVRGHVARRQGNHERARKHFVNAQRLLMSLDPQDLVPESEQLTVAHLSETLQLLALQERAQ